MPDPWGCNEGPEPDDAYVADRLVEERDDAREVPVVGVYSPTVGDRVRVLNHGNDFLVLGLADVR